MWRRSSQQLLCGVTLALLTVACAAHVDRKLIIEEEPYASRHTSIPCDPAVAGSVAACFDDNIRAAGNKDYPWGSPEISYPTNGAPWGVHLTGPYPDGRSYLITWEVGAPLVGPPKALPAQRDCEVPIAFLSTSAANGPTPGSGVVGEAITYRRILNQPSKFGPTPTNYSYLSPCINHVVVETLPGTQYFYWLSSNAGYSWSATPFNFTALKTGQAAYPLKIGLLGDLGQTYNSSQTRNHMIASNPDVILAPGDLSYATYYGARDLDTYRGGAGTNQNRWDSYAVLSEPLLSRVPSMSCVGNHEIEDDAIAAKINYTTTNFSYPTNYPFQSYAARQPSPGTRCGFGAIIPALYYSTVLAGVAKVITLANYIPFHPGTPQYLWAINEFKRFDRAVTPWLIVMYHAPVYTTYDDHYKEAECFRGIWEEVFYAFGVDIVVNGHEHAYERTLPIFDYQLDTCGPVHFVIGDGGNVGGPARAFVDSINPSTNKTVCQGLKSSGKTPQELQVSNLSGWGKSYQLQVNPPNCNTLSWQTQYSTKGAPVLSPLPSNNNLGFCQSSQPKWSGYRDPSFGHGILTLTSNTTAEFKWIRNTEQGPVEADYTKYRRNLACNTKRRVRHLQAHERRRRQLRSA